MTTTVTIVVSGSHKVRVSVAGQPDTLIEPGSHATRYIYGEQMLAVREEPAVKTQGGGGPGDPNVPHVTTQGGGGPGDPNVPH